MWSHRKAGLGLIASLLMVTGTATPLMAQDDPPPQEEPTGEDPRPEEDPEERIRRAAQAKEMARLRRLQQQQRDIERGVLPPEGEEIEPVTQTVISDLPPAPAEGQISLVFEGPVDLSAFVDFVAQTLKINIIEDQGLAGKSVVFRAPMTIPREELLPLLQALIEDSGFALVYDDLGFFRVRAETGIEPDFAGGEFATTRIIRTPLIRPSIAAQTLTQQIGGGGAPQGGPGGATGGLNFRLTPIDELGILIATGPSGTLEMIEKFTDELVSQTQGQKFIRLELRNVSASYARARVIALNAGADVAAGGQLAQGGAPPVPGGATGLLGNLESRLYVDQGNALLFRGSEEEASLVRDMISVLDEVTPLEVRRYVAGSVAMEAANAGERLGLGSVTITGDGAGSNFRGGGQTFAPSGTRMGMEQGVEPAASGFTVDSTTGSLIYYGTERQHERVQALVEQFKLTAIGDDIEIKTYKLLYAKAEGEEDGAAGVVDILTELLEDPSQQTTRTQFLPGSRMGSTTDQTTPDITQVTETTTPSEGATRLLATQENTIIVADPARNQVIIKAPRRAQAQFAELIAKLDQKQPQVMIEVQIISVTTTDNFNWEADVQLNFGQFSWFSGFGASIAEGASATAGATTLDPRTLPATTPGLTTGWIKSEYLPIAIQTLQTVGNTRVLSNPKILVNDNQPATFESIREVPYSASSQSSSTTIVSQGGTAEAGTTLEVTPRISVGGDITVEYSVELSDFTGPGVGGLQPPAQRDRYESWVTLPGDSTIIVGGFKLNRAETTENKIPLLGDVPLLGNLFKNYTKDKTKATIYVFITPRVMRDPLGEDLRLATRGPMQEVEVDPDVPAMEPSVIPIFGDVGPSIVPFNPGASAAATMDAPR